MQTSDFLAVHRPVRFWASPLRLALILACGGLLGILLAPITGDEWGLATGISVAHVLIVGLARASTEWTPAIPSGIKAAALGGQLRLTPLLFAVCYTLQRLAESIG